MSFQITSTEIELQYGHILSANVQRADGSWNRSRIDLNDFIGNDDGHFQWGGENYSESAKDITFSLEGVGNQPILRASLADREGEFHSRDINLAERIENQDGNLVYLG